MYKEARVPRQDLSPADVRQDGQVLWAKRKSTEDDTYKLIVEVAERLFREIGFQKTTVADIAREIGMSSANVYRFFAAKSELKEAVCLNLLAKIEIEAERIAASRSAAAQRLRDLIGTVETIYLEQYVRDRKLYDLIEASITKKWGSGRRHTERMTKILERVNRQWHGVGRVSDRRQHTCGAPRQHRLHPVP